MNKKVHFTSSVLLCLLLLTGFGAVAQKEANHWIPGFVGDGYLGGPIKVAIDFNNSTSPIVYNPNTPGIIGGSLATISDNNGSLLFYTGRKGLPPFSSWSGAIFNKSHQVVTDKIKNHGNGYFVGIFVPQPGCSKYYYLFHTNGGEGNYVGGSYYTKIDTE